MSEAAIPIPATRKIPSFRLPPSVTATIRPASETIRKASKETKPDDFSSLKPPVTSNTPHAPAPAQAATAPEAVAVTVTQKRKTVRIKGTPIDLEKAKTDIRAIESDNPYREKKQVVFPLQTRLSFQDDIYELYSSFEAKRIPESAIDYNACDKIAAGLQSSVEMYEYQKFVREYMRQASPYRGLLVYHGLGSGKTCSAIAAAEAIFSVDKKKIIVMTPFSLRDNFIREVSFCGFQHYRMENYWEKLESTRDDWEVIVTFAADVLGLPESYLRTAKTIWVPEFDVPSNIESLSGDDKEQIQKQIQAQIQSRITFINYNGISAKELKRYACEQPDIFDDAVIIVDEMHNLTRLMQGTIEPYLSNLQSLYQKRRKVQVEHVTHNRWKPALCDDPSKNYKRGYMLYRLLVGAKGSKIIGLSGTPLINFPEEVAILMNLLGGYIHTSSLYILSPVSDAQIKTINTMLQENEFIDYVEVKRDGKNTKVFLTMVPEGMKKIDRGVTRADKSPSFDELVKTVQAELEKMGFSTATPTFHSEPILPPIGDEFRKYFLDDKDDSRILNKLVIRKRIQGLISYYKGSKKELMPLVVKDELVRVPFSPYVHSQYCSVRVEELNASRKKSDSGDVPGIAGKMGSLWAELYGLASSKSSPSYRMYSRQVGTFAFPKNVRRPRPTREQVGEVLDLEVEGADEIVVERDDMPTEEETALAKEISKEEDATDVATADSADAASSDASEVLVLDQPPPEVATAAAVPMSSLLKEREQFKKNCLAGSVPGGTYSDSIRESKRCLRVFAKDSLTLLKRDGSPNPLGLSYHSPKYAEMLRRILESPGSNLVYSQFLEMEGIGIFLEVLKAQGFESLEISADGKSFSAETIKNLSGRTDGKDPRTIKRFLSFTGGETREKRTMALRVFNAKYDAEKVEGTRFKELPAELSAILESTGFTGNLKGELCSVFCITSAGAEGLSLRNVRRVHIMEPYWNHVRTDQVKGRAVRICSHVDLQYNPEPSLNERTVEVFTYCSVFHPDALRSGSSGSSEYVPIPETLLNDGYPAKDAVAMGFPVPEGVKDYVPTSDEYLYMLSQKKKTVLQSIQNLMKQSAIDCKINLYENEEDGLGCIALDGGFKEYAFHPLLKQDIILTKEEYPDDEAAASAPSAPSASAPSTASASSASATASASTAPSASAAEGYAATESATVRVPTAPKQVTRGIRMKSPDGREVYAYPEDGRVPALSYILYQWDDSFYRKNPDSSSTVLGRTGAKKDGSISSVGLTWSS